MALGSNEVSLLDLTGAFASVRSGRRVEPWGIQAFGAEGTGLRSLGAPSASTQELPYREQLTQLLREVVESGTGRGAALDGKNVAGKTGTSQDYRDAWFVGFTDKLVVGVWVGNDDRSPMNRVTGGSLPAEIWKRFVAAAEPRLQQSEPVAVKTDLDQPPIEPAKCDIKVCAAAYNSFRASDCTYQSYGGRRKLCTKAKGAPETSEAESQEERHRPGAKKPEAAAIVDASRSSPTSASPGLTLGEPAASAPPGRAAFGPEIIKAPGY